jgi:MHS family alpha-ketoglutarate permease-like MFS transporter
MGGKMGNMKRLRVILTGSAGHLVEWYDWYAYAACAIYFAPIFFPKGDQTSQLLQAAAIFAVGFFARPGRRLDHGAGLGQRWAARPRSSPPWP